MNRTTLIDAAGEIAIIKKLKDSEWLVRKIEDNGFGNSKIEAERDNLKILFQVKSAILPKEPDVLSLEESESIKLKANLLGANAYVARVWLNDDLFNTNIELNRLN